ncbi:MAG: leucyl/phenylalanyl-tRNA--protein transferase [Deferribacteres bacterium]|nr:leucyl/phenylalanyl-tRNA--protein transferase [candidate division KSB1 bacterium]MCB9500896.1 leucyl/phenylalanyl-tRNA--protein transferase [Deferribacteres bacterium]
MHIQPDLSIRTLIAGYSQGIFPMGDATGKINWYEANPRGILPLHSLHLPHDLKRVLRQGRFAVTLNHNFRRTMASCARTSEPTWITRAMIDAYSQLHNFGYAHSVESWYDGELAGGLYGVSIGGAFFGESMFFHHRDASKVALAHLWIWLTRCEFQLFDIQMVTDVLERFGAHNLTKEDYLKHLNSAVGLSRKLRASDIDWREEFLRPELGAKQE